MIDPPKQPPMNIEEDVLLVVAVFVVVHSLESHLPEAGLRRV